MSETGSTHQSVFCNAVASWWLTILLVWHFRNWSAGELAASSPECMSWNRVQVSQKAPQPQPTPGLSFRGRQILNFEVVGCHLGTPEKSQSQLALALSAWRAQGWRPGLWGRWDVITSGQVLSNHPVLCFERMFLFYLLFLILPFYWDIADVQHCVSFRCRACGFDTFIYCSMIATVASANTSLRSYNYHFVFAVRTIKISYHLWSL